jgi:hypothetical protein
VLQKQFRTCAPHSGAFGQKEQQPLQKRFGAGVFATTAVMRGADFRLSPVDGGAQFRFFPLERAPVAKRCRKSQNKTNQPTLCFFVYAVYTLKFNIHNRNVAFTILRAQRFFSM